MAAEKEVTLIIRARDRSRAVFRRIGGSLRRLRLGFGSLIGGLTFGNLAREAVKSATEIEGAAARLNVAGRDLEGLRIIAEDLDIPFSRLVGVMQRLSRNASDASDDNTRLLEAFRELGIATSPRELKGLTELELFQRLASAAATRNWRDIAGSIARVGDTEAVALRGLLEQGPEALRAQVDELERAGRLLSDQDRQEVAAAEAQLRRELATTQKALAEALVAFTPVLQRAIPLIERAVTTAEQVVRFGQETGGLGVGATAADIDPRTNRFGAAETIARLTPLGLAVTSVTNLLTAIEQNTANQAEPRI